MESLYQLIDYEEGFDPSEVLSSLYRNKFIDTHTIVSTVDRVKGK